MKLNFQQDALVLPASVLQCMSDADAAAMRVLLWLASDLSLYDKPRQLAKLADCDTKALRAILKFWSMNGVLAEEGAEQTGEPQKTTASVQPAVQKEKKTLLHRADELPSYTTTELAELMERRASIRALVDESQRILGKMFNPSEVNILVGMLDYLGMNEECILLLLAYCKKIGKSNLRSIEKMAYTLVDKGITEPLELEVYAHPTLEELVGD